MDEGEEVARKPEQSEFAKEQGVVYGIKGLGDIEKETEDMLATDEAMADSVIESGEGVKGRVPWPKTTLVTVEMVVAVEKGYETSIDHFLHGFTKGTGKSNGAIRGGIAGRFAGFREGKYNGGTPLVGEAGGPQEVVKAEKKGALGGGHMGQKGRVDVVWARCSGTSGAKGSRKFEDAEGSVVPGQRIVWWRRWRGWVRVDARRRRAPGGKVPGQYIGYRRGGSVKSAMMEEEDRRGGRGGSKATDAFPHSGRGGGDCKCGDEGAPARQFGLPDGVAENGSEAFIFDPERDIAQTTAIPSAGAALGSQSCGALRRPPAAGHVSRLRCGLGYAEGCSGENTASDDAA